jgi:hypothetical protein
MHVQWLAGKGQMRLAQSFALGRMSMDELRHVVGHRLPVEDQLRLADELTNPGADHVHSHHGAVLGAYKFHETRGLEDLALAVAAQVIGQRLDLIGAVLLLGLGLS